MKLDLIRLAIVSSFAMISFRGLSGSFLLPILPNIPTPVSGDLLESIIREGGSKEELINSRNV